MKAVVETRELTKRFGDNYALAGLTMAVPRGHIVVSWDGTARARPPQSKFFST
jgi:ABC-type transporter Mla maintaining outer membrane lipid asymmetry ATPase subunit MlaF